MERYCSTRLLKNAKFLQSHEVRYFPELEPIDGFSSLVPPEILGRLHQTSPEEIGIEKLAKAVRRKQLPTPKLKPVVPLFSGTLRFVRITFSSGGRNFAVPDSDLNVAMQYTGLVISPISQYASQYGPNKLALTTSAIPLNAPVTSGKYNDSILSGWVDQLAKANGFGTDSCLMFLNPQGVVNTDANPAQGVGGYHNISSSGVPYAFVNVMGQGLTVDDRQDVYAVALSHEIAEMTVDPKADGSNPEVCDSCAGNCSVDFRNYFDPKGNWLGGTATPGYSFFVDGIATPATVAQCPAPKGSCSYPPPKPTTSTGGI
jgi:hypothetical protein